MKVIKWIGIVLVALVALVVAAIFYFKSAAQARLDQSFANVKGKQLPIPYPLTEEELKKLREERAAAMPPTPAPAANDNAAAAPAAPPKDPLADVDLQAIAHERALARGKHYLQSRAGCMECHGEDFGGKVIIENPVMGKWIAPNITRGGLTKNYRPEDWDRIVRHGVLPSGKPATMPSIDFAGFSDQEVSDIAAYIQSLPPVARDMPKSVLGPVYAMLIANKQIPISAEVIDHAASRPKLPPSIAASVELGKHLGATCKGCHGEGFSGGPIVGGDPAWPAAQNLTFDDSGLAKWTIDDFRKALKDGVRPDGTKLNPVMPVNYTSRLAPEEVDSLYLYFKTVPKKALGNH
jgi:cytochrome c5